LENLGRHFVPSVIGTDLDRAISQIGAAGLPWDVHATALPPTSTANLYSAYCVTSQTPSSGTAIALRRGSHQIRMVELEAKPC
jgi:hypothetical protein